MFSESESSSYDPDTGSQSESEYSGTPQKKCPLKNEDDEDQEEGLQKLVDYESDSEEMIDREKKDVNQKEDEHQRREPLSQSYRCVHLERHVVLYIVMVRSRIDRIIRLNFHSAHMYCVHVFFLMF